MIVQPCDSKARRYRRGMTLLEVIVAMALLAIGITGVLGAISSCLRNTDAAASYSRAALLAQQVATELDRNETLDTGQQSGTFDELASSYRWEADVTEANASGLYPVRITVLWDKDRRHFELNTLLRPHTLPTPATPAAGGQS
ncbi:MAG TPA: prepilin-type N-terminal cleavage/methylation domain-containing protein [Armatimonadota bacterium]|jgi:general secretion pathway protein I